MKTEPLPSPKSSMKSIPKVTRGFISTHISCWLRNSHHQLSRRQLRIHHRNTFQRWRVDSEVLAAPVDWKKVNENWVAADSKIIIETALKGDTWIRKCSQPLLNEKLLMKTEPLLSLKSSTKSLPKVTRGFVSAPALVHLETVNENEPLSSPKSSMKPIPMVTRGFIIANSLVDSEIVNEN